MVAPPPIPFSGGVWFRARVAAPAGSISGRLSEWSLV